MAYVMSLEGPKLGAFTCLQGMFRGRVPGGKAEGLSPERFDPMQLAIGTRVEMEHTNDPYVAREIAMDHLVEDPAYYTKLRAVHLDGMDQRWFGVRHEPKPQVQFFGLNAFSRVPMTLAGATMLTIGGVVLGFWLSGSTPGQRLTRRITGRFRAR